MTALDLHVLVMDYTPRAWLEQCRASIAEAAAAVDFPVHVHYVPGVVGHIGLARQRGYAQGSAPFMTYVDDDDYVLPHAFACLEGAMRSDPAVIFTREIREQNGHQFKSDMRHHLAVYRRDVLAGFDYQAHPTMIDVKTADHANRLGAEDVLEHVYVHRLRLNSPSRLLRRQLRREGRA